MRAAVVANNFGTVSVLVGYALYCAGYFVVKAWPAAKRLEFIFRTVQRRIAALTNVQAFSFVVQ